MHTKKVCSIGLLFLAACSTSNQQYNPGPPFSGEMRSDVQLSEEEYVRLMNGVFEIVVPRIEDKSISYNEELPTHLLPYKIRKSPFRGVGTAFAIGPNKFVSAAHVFDLHQPSLVTPVYLRDSAGKTFAVNQVLRYSQHRDLIEFNLKSVPAKVQPLAIASESRIGQFVFTVGNALGDGIVTRSGYITSFTPEPVDGDWNDIRYSAPASPGNSGGPLLNKKLEVVGIVVRRTESENLNFAIPVKELSKVNKAEFFVQDIKLEQFKKQLSRDWRFSTSTPAQPADITKVANASYVGFQKKLYEDFEKKFKSDVFPTDPKLKVWAKDSLAYSIGGYIMKDTNDRWVTTPVDWNVHQLEPHRSLVIEKGADHSDTVLFMLERPAKTKLADFFKNPKGILDTFLKQMSWSRNFAGRKIGITSYGKPEKTSVWKDDYERKWRTYEWNSVFDDRTLQLHCMTMPAGVLCLFDSDPYRLRDLGQISTRRAINRFMIDIYGKIKDWKEWKTIPAEWDQQIIPKNVDVSLNSNGVIFKAGPFSGKITEKDFDDDAELSLAMNATAENIFHLRVRNIQIAEKDGDMQMGAGINLKPDNQGHPAYREVWDKMVSKRAPYNGLPQTQGKHSLIVSVMDNKMNKVHYITCGIISSVGEANIKKICDEFSKNVKFE